VRRRLPKGVARHQDAALEDLAEEARSLGADAIVGVDLDYASVGDSMLMVSVNGTAVQWG